MLCGTVKLAKLESKTLLPEMEARPLFTTVVFLVLPDTDTGLSLTDTFRGLPRVDFVFRPEVCLGAALRSLAPPLPWLS